MTYSNDIRYENTFAVRYKGLRLEASRAAIKELSYYGKTLWDALEILTEGYE